MIIRIRSSAGMSRVNVDSSATVRDLVLQVVAVCNPSEFASFGLYLRPNRQVEILQQHLGMQLSGIPLNHGDVVFLETKSPSVSSLATDCAQPIATPAGKVEEDDIDKLLQKKDGMIQRPKNSKLCRHGNNNKCLNCVALDPFDAEYLKSRDPPIKFLSMHSHLRKLTSKKFFSLEDMSCRIKPGCTEHLPWPKGICTKCQPGAITMDRQTYRHIDNIMFEDGRIVDRFLDGWRESGMQRIGFLYGRLEEYNDVPLGIKAVVSVIYEPPQISSALAVELIASNEEEQCVDQVAQALGLRRIGWIFTDLEGLQNGKVAYKRYIDTFFLSSQECITAAHFQSKHPSPCRLADSGYFGSKYVTICVSGDEKNNIHLAGYQVSNQCMALVRDSCLVPTVDAPELAYVKDSTEEQFIPDAFYKTKDDYGNEVSKLAQPLPVEFLLVELTVSTPKEQPCPTLPGGKNAKPFPIANRGSGHIKPNFGHLAQHFGQQILDHSDFGLTMADFHLLLHLYQSRYIAPTVRDGVLELCELIKRRDGPGIDQWRLKKPWTVIEQLMVTTLKQMSSASPPRPGMSEDRESVKDRNVAIMEGAFWACLHCTFNNSHNVQVCDMCQLPRNS